VIATSLLPTLAPLVMVDDDIGPLGPSARLRVVDVSRNTPSMDLGVVGVALVVVAVAGGLGYLYYQSQPAVVAADGRVHAPDAWTF